MNAFTSLGFLRSSSLGLSLAGLLTGLLASACDLPDKNLGDDPAGTTGDVCEPGDTKMMDCNTCECSDGGWSCTEIGCDPTGGAESGGLACDPADEPVDECNTCECVDGEWLCTAIGCDPTAGLCDPAENPTDGCNTCECDAGGQWICTDEACPENPAVELCQDTDPTDPLVVTEASIAGDSLSLTVQHSGGCVAHGYGSCWDSSFAESDPVQAWVAINHEDNDDPCDGVVEEALIFDLTPIRSAWIESYQQPSGTIMLHVADWGTLDYSF